MFREAARSYGCSMPRISIDLFAFLESGAWRGTLGHFLRELALWEQRLPIRPAFDFPAPPQGLPTCLVVTISIKF